MVKHLFVLFYLRVLILAQHRHVRRLVMALCFKDFSRFACFFSKLTFFFKISFKNTIRVSNGLDPDLGPKFQTVCKGNQQTIKVVASIQRV